MSGMCRSQGRWGQCPLLLHPLLAAQLPQQTMYERDLVIL